MKRLYSLDLLKLVFAYVIAFFHFGFDLPPGPTVTVQIFFFISGFFLARKFYARSYGDGGNAYGPWNYALDHAKSHYPHYLFAYVAYLLYSTARTAVTFLQAPSFAPVQETLLHFYDQIPNLLFLQSAYTFHDSMNYPLWQLSALAIGGYFVYALLCSNEKLSRQLLFPAAILMTLSLQASGVAFDANYGPVYMPLLRAFCGLSYGVLVYYFTTTPWYEALRSHKIFFNATSLLSLVCIFVYAGHGNIHFITGAMLILGCCESTSWLNALLNRHCFRHAGKLSLSIYLNHALICRLLNGFLFPRLERFGVSQSLKNLAYFVILTAYSVFTLVLVEKLHSLWKHRRTVHI